jgi:putative tryptophan/tyrosine transport system substrate-binding protein
MQRREFIAGLGAAGAWPRAVLAQPANRVARVGVLMGYEENDPEGKVLLSAFTQGLMELGWSDGRNARIDSRWGAGNVGRMQAAAKEVVDLQPDVILAHTTPVTAALQRMTHTIPIVFAIVADPVGSRFVASFPSPGGSITGIVSEEATTIAKRLQLLGEIAPAVKRAAIIFNPDTAPGAGSYYLPAFQAGAQTLKIESIVAPVRSDAEIESVLVALGREPRGGLVVMNDGFLFVHRAQIISMAAANKVPSVYWDATFARDGGLLGYGPDRRDIFHRAATYVDRILRGAKPAELPVQAPVKFEMAFNAKTADALGLSVPPSIRLLADEVIE